MRKLIEYTLISADGVFDDPEAWQGTSYRDEDYLRDGLGLLLSCDTLLMGRGTYESCASIWPKRSDPWAKRLNVIQKFVFSSKMETADWVNSTIIRGDVVEEVTKLKNQNGSNLLIWGHGLLAETLLKEHLLDVLDLAIHPVIVGHGKLFFRKGENTKLKLVATKSFSQIVRHTYVPEY